jgi:hypothetical protein
MQQLLYELGSNQIAHQVENSTDAVRRQHCVYSKDFVVLEKGSSCAGPYLLHLRYSYEI